jgi:hypothetical protein
MTPLKGRSVEMLVIDDPVTPTCGAGTVRDLWRGWREARRDGDRNERKELGELLAKVNRARASGQ